VRFHISYDVAKAIMAEQSHRGGCAGRRQRERAAYQVARDTWTRSSWGRISCLCQNLARGYLP
jgi:hypothetical protein